MEKCKECCANQTIDTQQILAYLGTKLGIRAESVKVSHLPTVGQTNLFYVINDDTFNPNKANIYVWNATLEKYVWVGDNTLVLEGYYTKQEGKQLETEIKEDVNETLEDFKGQINEDIGSLDDRVSNVEDEIQSVASGSPKGVYATLSDLETAHPTGDTGIYVVSADGNWYYWNSTSSEWTSGGVYQSSVGFAVDNSLSTSSENPVQNKVITGAINDLQEDLTDKIDETNDNIDDTLVIKSYTDVSPTATNGWKQSNGSVYTAQGIHLEITLVQGGEYLVSGSIVNSSFPLIVYEDENGVVVGTEYTGSDTTAYIDTLAHPPVNATKMFINGYDKWNFAIVDDTPTVSQIYPRCVKITNTLIDNVKKELDSKATKQLKWVADTNYLLSDWHLLSSDWQNATIKNDTATGYGRVKVAFDRTKKYRISGYDFNITSSVLGVAFITDKNNNIIWQLKGTTNNVPEQSNYHIFNQYELNTNDIPKEAAYLYVSCRYVELATITPVEIAEERYTDSLNDNGKKIICLGDSITQGVNAYEWYYFTAKSHKDYPSIIGEILNADVYNGGLGGALATGNRAIDLTNVVNCLISQDYSSILAGISTYNVSPSATYNYNEISGIDIGSVDAITIMIGFNDFNNNVALATYKQSLKTNIINLLTEYQQLNIYLFTPIIAFNSSGQSLGNYTNSLGLSLLDYADAVKEVAEELCVPCKDCIRTMGINDYNRLEYFSSSDNVHPKQNGYKHIADKCAKFINGN